MPAVSGPVFPPNTPGPAAATSSPVAPSPLHFYVPSPFRSPPPSQLPPLNTAYPIWPLGTQPNIEQLWVAAYKTGGLLPPSPLPGVHIVDPFVSKPPPSAASQHAAGAFMNMIQGLGGLFNDTAIPGLSTMFGAAPTSAPQQQIVPLGNIPAHLGTVPAPLPGPSTFAPAA